MEDDDHTLFHNSDYYDLDGSFATTDNTLVRSKGETILHDLLRAFFIPFDYEPILYMDESPKHIRDLLIILPICSVKTCVDSVK